MIKVTMKAGDKFSGFTIQEIIEALRKDCKIPSHSRMNYKHQLAKRFHTYYGKRLNFISDEKFLYGLFEAGEIKLIEDDENEEISE